jgi:hypothetical protein
MNGAPVVTSSLSVWGDFISKVGFPIVAAMFLAWAVWHLSRSVTDIETTLHNRDVIFAKINSMQDVGHSDLDRLDKDVNTLLKDHQVLSRRLDDLYRECQMKPEPPLREGTDHR